MNVIFMVVDTGNIYNRRFSYDKGLRFLNKIRFSKKINLVGWYIDSKNIL